jgi:hypothetical protein
MKKEIEITTKKIIFQLSYNYQQKENEKEEEE